MQTETLSSKQGNVFPGGGMYCKPEADKRAQIVNCRRFGWCIDDDQGSVSQAYENTISKT